MRVFPLKALLSLVLPFLFSASFPPWFLIPSLCLSLCFLRLGSQKKEGLSDHAASATPFRITWKPFGQFYANLTAVESWEADEFLQAL